MHRVLVRHGVNRLRWMDRPTGRLIRRYEHDHPGDLVHVDIKRLGRIRPGGGWRAHGRGSAQHRAARHAPRVGYEYIHTAIDDHSRVAYSEILDDETAATAVEFWRRAQAWFDTHGITTRAVLTDNGSCYRARLWQTELADAGIAHRYTRPYRPQTNGKVCEDLFVLHRPRSDPGKGMTIVSCVRFVGRCWCSTSRTRADRAELT